MAVNPAIQKQSLLKRAITYIESQRWTQAFKDVEQIIEQDPINSEAYYFKGLIYYK
jgi:Tfp pilus assembly protein PilF